MDGRLLLFHKRKCELTTRLCKQWSTKKHIELYARLKQNNWHFSQLLSSFDVWVKRITNCDGSVVDVVYNKKYGTTLQQKYKGEIQKIE